MAIKYVCEVCGKTWSCSEEQSEPFICEFCKFEIEGIGEVIG
jgi:ribosomal protein L37AE/L43A